MALQDNEISSTVNEKTHKMEFTIIPHFRKLGDFSAPMHVHTFGLAEQLLGEDNAYLDYFGHFVDCRFEKYTFTEVKVTMWGSLDNLCEGRNMLERLLTTVQKRLDTHLASLPNTEVQLLIAKKVGTCGECGEESFPNWLYLKEHCSKHS